MTYEWDALLNGPEHNSSWANDCVERVSNLLAIQPTGPGRVVLRWHVGGSFAEPGWTGPGKPHRKGSEVVFHVGLPRRVHDAELEDTLLDFAAEAAGQAGHALASSGRATFDEEGHRRAVEIVRQDVRALEPAAVRRESFRASEERSARRKHIREAVPEVYREPGRGPALPVFEFAWSSEGEVDALLDFEQLVDDRLRAGGLGGVDGNEIGEGNYRLFVAPRRGKRSLAISLVEHLAMAEGLSLTGAPR